MVDFTVLVDARSRAKERAAAPDTSEVDSLIDEYLELSAGVDDNSTTHFRPYYVAALYLQQSRRDQTINEADGAKFTLQKNPIMSLLQLQYGYDQDKGLSIPSGFEATASAFYPSSSTYQKPFKSRTVGTNVKLW